MSGTEAPRRRFLLLAIFVVSFGLLVDEIMLSAIFHVLLGAGNTVAAIAIALIGLSAGGIVVYSVPSLQRPGRAERLSRQLLFVFAAVLAGSIYAIMAVPISHGDLIYRAGEPSVQLWRLVVYHLTVLPFFVGGIVIAVIFRSDPAGIGKLYFADLSGAALGCVASPLLLAAFGAPGAVLAASLLPMVVWCVAGGRPSLRVAPQVVVLLALVGLGLVRPHLLSFATINTMGQVASPGYRSFAIHPGDIEFERWALDAWTIIRGAGIPQQWEDFKGWGLSPHYEGPIPETRLVNYNARFSTYVTKLDAQDARATAELDAWLDADLSSLHHLIGREYRSVLNIGAGGGRETLAALRHGAERVVAVDVSAVVVDEIMKGVLREFSGELYLDPRVEAIADEGRSFTERSRERFDLIEFSIVGGMNLEKMDLVRVDDLFTREALETYLSRLTDDGLLSYVMYSTRADLLAEMALPEGRLAQPYAPALRTLTGLRMALAETAPDVDFADHVLVAALPKVINPKYDLVHILVSLRAFSEEERSRFTTDCARLGFVPLVPGSPNPYQLVSEASDLDALADSLPFGIWPATDDRPFQYALTPKQIRRASANGELLALVSGNPLVSMGLTVGLLAVLLTFAPLLLSSRRAENAERFRASWSLLLYFACIGFAYMAVEIAALLRLQTYLGKPIYGLSVGLFSFLLASSIGSSLTHRIGENSLTRAAGTIAASITLVGTIFIAVSGPLFAATVAFPISARIGMAIATIFPLALLMGMLFPIGIRLIARDAEDLVPWAWATNGCFSVLGIFLTRITALVFGFSRALALGLLVYLFVLVCLRAHRGSPRHST